ncbi:hypothetical protein GCM10011325_48950 [Dyadobacter sediminis]|nr:hypothetical protein GCM10011325_48950 [Dyadobacter sediminis]
MPGVHLNFSKNGVSTTIGRKGASVNYGKKGTFLNLGIPGTGVYSRQKLTSNKTDNYTGDKTLYQLCEDSEKLLKEVNDALNCFKTIELKIEWYKSERDRDNISESQLQEKLFILKNDPKYKEARIYFGMDIDPNKSDQKGLSH